MTGLTITLPSDSSGVPYNGGSTGMVFRFTIQDKRYWFKSYELLAQDAKHAGELSLPASKVELRTVAEFICSRLALHVLRQRGFSSLVIPEYHLVLQQGVLKGLCSTDVPNIHNGQDFGMNQRAMQRLIKDKRIGVLHALRWLLQDPDGLENTFYQFKSGVTPEPSACDRVVALDWGLACYPLLKQEQALMTEAEINRAPHLDVFAMSEAALKGCDASGNQVPGLLHEADKWDDCLLVPSIDSNWARYSHQKSAVTCQFYQDVFAIVAGFESAVGVELRRLCAELVAEVPALSRSVECVQVYLEQRILQLRHCCKALLRGESPRSVVAVDLMAKSGEASDAQSLSEDEFYPAYVLHATLVQFQRYYRDTAPLTRPAKLLKSRLGIFVGGGASKMDTACTDDDSTAPSVAVEMKEAACKKNQ